MTGSLLVVVALLAVGCGSSANTVAKSPSVSLTCAQGTKDPVFELVLTDTLPSPVTHVPGGSCVRVEVPYSPLGRSTTPRAVPAGTVRLVSDDLNAQGTRIVYYIATKVGSTRITASVDSSSKESLPEWAGILEAA